MNKTLNQGLEAKQVYSTPMLLETIPRAMRRRRMALGMVSSKELEAENRRLKKELQVAWARHTRGFDVFHPLVFSSMPARKQYTKRERLILLTFNSMGVIMCVFPL
jgi:hypothetical protein